ncbi:tyrosine-type recombinase/integrase [Novosphingobium beihaiensis]|uniref:Integrase arm-type DNA-binding domain-containing protein n=1 Tax=Novosphingobium beihaiensis TaxID=2930389 RepID=A0ABT0BNP5_9SPHN|nr:integrase arm-type DNA-binding domain-containing protein [Novosphingobium beihaiensis]MCJ2186671.1 integrase arm-type DNA-binding domain-containing protein [Novosphingobium beihaiensis]
MPLTNNTIKNARPRAKDWKLADEKGLYLLITPKGSKLWRMKFRHHGVERKLSFGAWPDITLRRARELRDEARAAVSEGRDPARERKVAKREGKYEASQTFAAIADELIEKDRQEGRAAVTIKKKEWLLGKLKAAFGSAPIAEITTPEMFAVLDRIQKTGLRETTKRLRSVAGQVFNYAIATGRATNNPTLALQRALLAPDVTHMAAIIDVDDLRILLRKMDECSGYPSTLAALRITPHLFQRPGEIRKMKWANLDLDRARWSPPIADMKKRRPHDVPLSRQAMAIIREMEQHRNGPFVFPAFHTGAKPISENTVNGALRRLGYAGVQSAHGFRSTASSLLNERGKWDRDVIDRAMSRQVGNATSAIYNRTAYWDERVEMMQWWSDWLDELKAGET